MDETPPRKWRHILVFIVGTFLSVGVMLYMAERFFPNTASSMIPRNDRLLQRFVKLPNWETAGYRPLYDKSTGTVTLSLNQSYDVEDIRITYRGLSGKDKLAVEVLVLSFDPETPFRYKIPIDTPNQTFQLARKKFELISAKRNRFQFRHLPDSSYQ